MQGLRQASEAGTQYPSSEMKELGPDICWDTAKVHVSGHRDIRAIPKTPFNGTPPTPHSWASPVAQWKRILLPVQDMWVRSLDWEDPLEKEYASIPAREIPWTKEPGGLQSMGSQERRLRLERLNDNEQPPGLSLLAAFLMKHHGPWGGFPPGWGSPASPFCGTASSRPSPARRPTSRGSAGDAAAGRWGGPACPSS